MINKKIVITAVLSTALIIGNSVQAGSSDLLRMDLKKAAGDDSVDVTFYTTGSAQNTVVTRKSGNSYVVLLPNVSGNQSVVPSLGGVKDLVSNVTVKNVDDGIGGYTKVTFSTTKPVKFQTSTKNTAPLTKAQQDYKNLIAQNSKFDPNKKAENFKTSTPAKTSASAVKTPSKPVNTNSKTAQANSKKTETPANNKVALRPAVTVTHTQNTKTAPAKTTVKPQVQAKQQVKNQTKPQVKLQPKQNLPKIQPKNSVPANNIQTKQPEKPKAVQKPAIQPVAPARSETKPVVNNTAVPAKTVNKPVQKTVQNNKQINTKNVNKETKGLPIFPVLGALSVLGLFILAAMFNVIARAASKNSNKLKKFVINNKSEQNSDNKEYYNKIARDNKLNWQEKYKLYSEKEKDTVENTKDDTSYIAGMNNSKGAIIHDEDLNQKVSQLEHALSQTPSMTPPENTSKKVQSAEDAIANSMSNIKLKSFAKHIDLKETNRSAGFKTEHKASEPLKESPYVKLKPSALSVSRRDLPYSGFNISDLLRKGRKRFYDKEEVQSQPQTISQDKEGQEPYAMSSMSEYLGILDSEQSSLRQNISEQISNLMPQRNRQMLGVTNPMQKSETPFKTVSKTSSPEEIVIKSKHDIDKNKSILMADVDGISSIIGKIGENVFVLKKFDKIINKPLQVRLDYGNVYIVKAGGFKCLVDVSDSKMGTLLEI